MESGKKYSANPIGIGRAFHGLPMGERCTKSHASKLSSLSLRKAHGEQML
jgi:hypothetical protein